MDDGWITHNIEVGPKDLAREWLLTNGTGAFAMGTVAGLNRRRYHGLLIAASKPPVGRIVGLNQMLERLTLANKPESPLQFTTCAFRDDDGNLTYAPQGEQQLVRFQRGLAVKWTYVAGEVVFVRELHLHWKQQAVTVRYHVRGAPGATLSLYPMVTLRNFHDLLHRAQGGRYVAMSAGGQVTVQRDGIIVTVTCDQATFTNDPQWWHDLYYPIEAERGQSAEEDHYLPGRFDLTLSDGDPKTFTLTAALGPAVEACPTESARARHLTASRQCTEDLDHSLLLTIAADDFVVERDMGGKTQSTILAGYPWFADWGRDTFISLPGLLLTTGRFDEALATLRVFSEMIRDGLVPNRFDDYDDQAAHYNTVDASLWFIHAALEYVEATGDTATWDDWLSSAVMSVIEAYIQGTQYDIAVAGDGLITAGSPETQLTWMDAACDGTIFTPRFGKVVEINALWHHALVGTTKLIAERDPKTADHYRRLASRARRAFGKVFWNDDAQCLRDHVSIDAEGNDRADPAIRPNQIFAVSVTHSPLPRTKQLKVIKTVTDRLLTPYGLRTLATDDPNYHGAYIGPAFKRDEAYHQGTVWPWLIGPYAEAVLRAGQFKPNAVNEARNAIEPLIQFMTNPGIGQLHEIHEGDLPYRPVGCVAQAWSVAQVLRVLDLIQSATDTETPSTRAVARS